MTHGPVTTDASQSSAKWEATSEPCLVVSAPTPSRGSRSGPHKATEHTIISQMAAQPPLLTLAPVLCRWCFPGGENWAVTQGRNHCVPTATPAGNHEENAVLHSHLDLRKTQQQPNHLPTSCSPAPRSLLSLAYPGPDRQGAPTPLLRHAMWPSSCLVPAVWL